MIVTDAIPFIISGFVIIIREDRHNWQRFEILGYVYIITFTGVLNTLFMFYLLLLLNLNCVLGIKKH